MKETQEFKLALSTLIIAAMFLPSVWLNNPKAAVIWAVILVVLAAVPIGLYVSEAAHRENAETKEK